jgi:predicted ATPase/DNA-binding SARP family transcriptional activator/Tfp pilus assembly protein PilF
MVRLGYRSSHKSDSIGLGFSNLWAFSRIIKAMLRLLGTPRFEGTKTSELSLERPLWLVAFLAARETWVSREELVLLFWSEADEASGRQSLRQLLYRTRGLVFGHHLETETLRVRYNGTSDIALFKKALHDQDWASALELYTAEFLHHINPVGSLEFESWLEFEREELQSGWRNAVLQRAAQLEALNEFAAGFQCLDSALKHDPLNDEFIRALLKLAGKAKLEQVGLSMFERFGREFKHALELEVPEDIRDLAANLRTGLNTLPSAENTVRREVKTLLSQSNLPINMTAFVGRQNELLEVRNRCSNPECRLLTLVGAGGIGKTRLALEVARQSEDEFRDGVIFVSLAPLENSALLEATILEALGLKISGDQPQQQLIDHLRDKHLLLVLDNFEHLLESSAVISSILEHALGARVLATSREALGLRGEWVIELEGLPNPDHFSALESQDAANLFSTSARRVNSNFKLELGDLPDFSRICKAVAGMPLGLEIASSWTRVLSLGEIAEELEQDPDSLEISSRDLPERQRSLRAVFEHSWNLLRPVEQAILARLSVFRGGFDRDAALEIAGARLPSLLALVQKSLVQKNPEKRFELHSIVRQYSERKLEALDLQITLAKHSQYYLKNLEQAHLGLVGPQMQLMLEAINSDHDNFRAALEFGLQFDPVGGARICHNLESFWYVRGHHTEGLTWAKRYLEHPDLQQPNATRVQLLFCASSLSKEVGQYQESRAWSLERLALCQKLGDVIGQAKTERFLGVLAREQGHLPEARERLERAVAQSQNLNQPMEHSIANNDLGIVYAYQDEPLKAQDCFQKSLSIKRELGDQQGIAYALGNLAQIAFMLGNAEHAHHIELESLALKRELGDLQGIANSLANLGENALKENDYDQARSYFDESLSILRTLGRRFTIGELFQSYVELARREGQFERSLRLIGAILNLHRSIGAQIRPENQEKHERILNEARAHLGNAKLEQVQSEGENANLETMIAYALREPEIKQRRSSELRQATTQFTG